jgi:hypothetical protein
MDVMVRVEKLMELVHKGEIEEAARKCLTELPEVILLFGATAAIAEDCHMLGDVTMGHISRAITNAAHAEVNPAR